MASITFTETGGIEANSFSANGEIFVGAVGMVIWWSGTLATIPSNAKVCNGQTLSSSAYPKLYSKIGTKYGGSSSNFALPDLRVSSATSNGRFIRARFDDNVTYQDDAIRNIIGQALPHTGNSLIYVTSIGGAMSPLQYGANIISTGSPSNLSCGINFDANGDYVVMATLWRDTLTVMIFTHITFL